MLVGMTARWMACLLAAAMGLGVVGCGAKDTPPDVSLPGGLPRAGLPVGGQGDGTSDEDTSGSPTPADGTGSPEDASTGQSSSRVTPDDERTFAYGTTDLTQLTKDTATMQDDVSALQDALTARNSSAAKKAATALEMDATVLSRDAKDAKKRMQPLRPAASDLVDAREACLTVYGLASSYADTALGLADAVRAASAAQLASSLAQANALVGTGQQLSSALTLAEKSLQTWARANPKEAAQALAKYGG